MFRLARELNPPVIVTSTTHLGAWQTQLADAWRQGVDALEREGLCAGGVTVVTGPAVEDNRVCGLALADLDRVRRFAREHDCSLLIEADGSRQLPLKAPAAHEPVIPSWAEVVVTVAGLGGIGKPCNNAYIHRAEIFAELSGLEMDAAIGEESLVRVLVHPLGGLKGIPGGVRKIALLNQADDASRFQIAARLADPLLAAYDAVLTGCLQRGGEEAICAAHEPVAGIILAAGGSTRFGVPKQALAWRDRSFLENVIRCALDAGLQQILVITNNAYSQLINIPNCFHIQAINNPNWQSGQSTSVRLGVQSLPANVGGAVFLLCDQPQIPAQLVRALVQRHAETHAPIVAPFVGERRANPVLFDRSTFPDLLALQGDQGGRGLFSRYRVESVSWNDERILLDVDTPEDYARLLELE